MTLFVLAILLVLTASAVCSLAEGSLYAVRMPYIRQLADTGSLAGRVMTDFKQNMERPISAILIVNTVANTAGAAIAGAQARLLFGETALIWFSIIFTLTVLFVSEIIPKILGVVYHQPVSRILAPTVALFIRGLYPLVWLVERISRLFKSKERILSAPEEEIRQMVLLGAEEGSIMPMEAKLIRQALKLNDVRARDIMTPASVVFQLPSNMTLREVSHKVKDLRHSRIPVYDAEDPEVWMGVTFSRDILARLANDEFDLTLSTMCHPIYFVSEMTPGHVLLRAFLNRRTHLFGVMHERGGLVGIVTLEDVMESLIGEEIVDESDTVVDMQEMARLRRRQQFEEANADPGAAGKNENEK